MQIVIDIDDNLYTRLFDKGDEYVADMRRACVAIRKGTPLDNLRTELEDYITHSPYIKSFTDCCHLRDDVMRIIDRYRKRVDE